MGWPIPEPPKEGRMEEIVVGSQWINTTTGQTITVSAVKFSNITNVNRVYWEGDSGAGLADFIFITLFAPKEEL
jgi:hypothetical protein